MENKNIRLEKRFNFGIVNEGKLYRSSQPDQEFIRYLRRECGIKTIVALRIEIDDKEKEFCDNNGILLAQLPVKSWRRWPEPEEMQNFFKILEDQEKWPILIHCKKGKDRTSAAAALYRLKYENWKLKEAVAEMKRWKANWFWRLFIQTSAHKVIAGFKERNILLLYLKRFLNLIFAFEGLVYALKHEKNLRILCIFEAVFLGIALWRGISLTDFLILLLLSGALDSLEMFNSAVERLADLTQPAFDQRIKIIKDLLAGGTTLFGIVSFVVWVILVFF